MSRRSGSSSNCHSPSSAHFSASAMRPWPAHRLCDLQIGVCRGQIPSADSDHRVDVPVARRKAFENETRAVAQRELIVPHAPRAAAQRLDLGPGFLGEAAVLGKPGFSKQSAIGFAQNRRSGPIATPSRVGKAGAREPTGSGFAAQAGFQMQIACEHEQCRAVAIRVMERFVAPSLFG